MKNNFSNFTNQYSLSKTLRFELKPIGSNGQRLSEEESSHLLTSIIKQDRKIKDAYVALKPVIDQIHEDIINQSLTSDEAKKINFSKYFEEYKKGKAKKLDNFEKELREDIGTTFAQIIKSYKITKITKKKEEERPVFEIKKNVPIAKVEIIDYLLEKYKESKELGDHIQEFKGFFGYFDGYNKNRANYYEFTKEANTSVVTRIVHENLPKFCDNTIQFEVGKAQKKKKETSNKDELATSRKMEYLNAYQFLKDSNRDTKIKDAECNEYIEAYPITENTFTIENFSNCLSQAGIEEYNKVVGHYNMLINLYNQAKKSEKDFKKLPPFKTLFKQIGCGEKKNMFEQIESDEELKNILDKISEAGKKYFLEQTDEAVTTIHTFTKWLRENEDWDGVYWSKVAVDKVSNKYLANWHNIKDRIQTVLQSKDKEYSDLKDSLNAVATYNKKREEQLKINDTVELSGLFEILNQETEIGWSKIFFKESVLEERKSLIDESLTPSQNLINLICVDIEDFAKKHCSKSNEILRITNYKKEENILSIKEWLDTVKSVLWLIKYFEVKESKTKGNSINPELNNMLSELLSSNDANWFDWYDLVRNYLSKKPQDDAKKNKLKLNFESSSFLKGFSQEFKSKSVILIKKDGLYYLAVNNKLSKGDINSLNQINKETATRITIDFQKPDNKNTPRLFIRSKGDSYAPAVEKYKLPIEDIIEIYDNGKFKTSYRKENQKEYAESLHKLIDYFKTGFSKHESYKHYEFTWKQTNEYNDIAEFYHDTEVSCYQLKEERISWTKLLDFVKDEKIYLFQVYNKDFSQDKKAGGKDNIHTYYWKSLFDKKSTHKFGTQGAEIFFRERSINYSPEYDEQNKDENNKPREKGHHYEQLKNKFKYPIISNRRFTTNKFQFHCPIILNYKEDGKKDVTEAINNNFVQSPDIQFLGIDRGEKHLIYHSLLNAKGEIISQGHFDVIKNKDYLKAINDAAKRRREKQENWQQKGNISNLKDGYISLVIHEIIQKMKDKDDSYKPTFIVLEDLNTGFKRSRQKFEQQVYQKFELALAKKLNYLVDKSVKDINQIGSVANALQLTPPVANYHDIENRRQVGNILYTRANYTSVTDPVTGWRKTIYLKKGSEVDIRNQILEKFTEIGVKDDDYFFKYKDENINKEWTLWSGKNGESLERYRAKRGKDKNEYVVESFDVKALLDNLFEKFDKSKPLKQQIENGMELQKNEDEKYKKWTAWEQLRFVIDIIQQIRNSGDTTKKQDDNFLLSPIRNEQGEHFDSRHFKKQDIPKLPKDADANGAYNIARKGIIMYKHIKHLGDQWNRKVKIDGNDTIDLDLFVSDKEWDLWLADREEWKKNLGYFASREAKSKNNP